MLYKYSNHVKLYLMILFGIIASFQNIIAAYMIQTLTNIATEKRWEMISNFLLLVIIGLTITFISSLIFNRLKTNIIQKVNIYLRSHLFQGMLNKDEPELGFLTNDFKMLETNRFDAQIEIIMEIFSLIFALTYALAVNWIITILFLLGSCVPMFVSSLFQKSVQNASNSWTKSNSKYVNQTNNFLAGSQTLKLYHGEYNATKKNLERIVPLERALKKMNLLNLDTNSWINFIAEFVTFLLPFTIGILMVVNNMTTLGALFAIVQLSNSFVNPILTILEDRNKLSTTKKITQKAQRIIAKTNPTKTFFTNFNSLQLDGITLIRKDKKLITNLNLKIKEGQKIAIIGPSGSGKSTLLQNLLYGKFGDINQILLNNQKVSAGNFTELFAYASQNPVVFADTLWFNLTLEKTISQEIVTNLCTQLELNNAIKENGFNYPLGENADKLSGGQLARIELARAILSKRPIMLLDEINASLDRKTSESVHNYLLNSKLTFIEVIHHYEKNDLNRYDQVIDLTHYLAK